MPLRSGETFAGFRIVRLLGSGGMGEVYLAEHPRLPRHCGLVPTPPAARRTQARRPIRLNHRPTEPFTATLQSQSSPTSADSKVTFSNHLL